MTILILDNSPSEIAKSLDDKSLDEMIKSIAQTLCNVNWFAGNKIDFIPLKSKGNSYALQHWSTWGFQCVANYKWLVELGLVCIGQYKSRFYISPENILRTKFPRHEMKKVIEWARENVPDLPRYFNQEITLEVDTDNHPGSMTPLPLVMPDKFKVLEYKLSHPPMLSEDSIIKSYRNYYNHLLSKAKSSPTWTRRNRPEWVNLESETY